MKISRTPTKTTVISSQGDQCSLAENAGDGHFVSLVLQHLAADIEHNSEKLKVVDAQLVSRIRSLVLGVDVDLDAPLSPDDE